MKLAVVLAPGAGLDPGALLPGARVRSQHLLPPGHGPPAALLALLGRDPRAAWTGPAPFALAAEGLELSAEETACLLTPVRVDEDERIAEVVRLRPQRTSELLAHLDELLAGEALQLVSSTPPVLALASPLAGPPALHARQLVGRALSDLPAGPPALLERVIDRSAESCAELGGAATHLFPHTPGGPPTVIPLREAWLGLDRGVVVGASAVARALAFQLRLRHAHAPTGGEVEVAAEVGADDDVVVVVAGGPPASLEPLAGALSLAVASDVDREGRVAVAWRGVAELGEGVDLLAPLALARA